MNRQNDKPNLKRENTLKVPLNDPEASQLRKFCTSIGKEMAPFIRDIAFAHIRAEANRTAGKRRMEWPRHGHMQRFPGRAMAAGGCQRMRL